MKQSFILGGLLGFALCFLSALTAGSDADTALLEAVVCGLVAATLFRWLHHVMDKQLSATEREREAAASEAAAAATLPTPGQSIAASERFPRQALAAFHVMATLTQLLPANTANAGTAAWRAYQSPALTADDPDAERDLIERHLPLVKTVVGRMRVYLPPHLDVDDLQGVGLVGLMTAVRRYDPQQGQAFHGYAMLCIRGAILDELRRMDWMPRALRGKAKQIKETISRLEGEHGRAVTEREAADALGMGVDDYRTLLDEVRPISFVPLDGDADESGESGFLHETIADEDQPLPGEALERRELLASVAGYIQRLPDMQRKVLALYYHEEMRLSEIAAVFDVTESRISQIHTQAVLSLRAYVQRALRS